MMDKARIRVDFNELVGPDLVLLSKTDVVLDSSGAEVLLVEGMPVSIYEYNDYGDGTPEYLLADGIAELNDYSINGEWTRAAKWCCRIDGCGIRNEAGESVWASRRQSGAQDQA
ncbi:MAG: hypothetical protein AB1437_17905 [Pseudomonadota bacterium]